MKSLKFFSLAMVLMAATATLASGMYDRQPIPFTASVIKGFNDPLGFKNTPVTVVIVVKDSFLLEVYSETHTLNTNELAEVKTNIGTGSNQTPAYNTANFGGALTVCYTITVHDPEGDVILMGESPLGLTAHSVNAETSQNTHAIGNVPWGTDRVEPIELFTPPSDVTFILPAVMNYRVDTTEKSIFRQLPLNNYFSSRTSPSAVNDMPVDYLSVGTGNPCPMSFGFGDLVELENFYTIYPGAMDKFYNAFGVKVPAQRGPIGHSTAAVYAEHLFDPQGVGIFARARHRGIYSQGLTGVLGLSTSELGINTAALWAFIAAAAASGDVAYGVLAQDNDQANAVALGVFGGGFATKPFNTPSDRRLKTDIRAGALGLDVVMQLRPTQFRFIQNTPYSFDDGDQQGFIAQEVEEVIPGLVTELVFPKSLDQDKMATSGTERYKAINYSGLIPILTKALQELNDKVDAQAAEITRLSTELKACKPK